MADGRTSDGGFTREVRGLQYGVSPLYENSFDHTVLSFECWGRLNNHFSLVFMQLHYVLLQNASSFCKSTYCKYILQQTQMSQINKYNYNTCCAPSFITNVDYLFKAIFFYQTLAGIQYLHLQICSILQFSFLLSILYFK